MALVWDVKQLDECVPALCLDFVRNILHVPCHRGKTSTSVNPRSHQGYESTVSLSQVAFSLLSLSPDEAAAAAAAQCPFPFSCQPLVPPLSSAQKTGHLVLVLSLEKLWRRLWLTGAMSSVPLHIHLGLNIGHY